MLTPDRTIPTTCPYCGVGCQMNLHVKDDFIYRVSAPFDAAPNFGMLCVKGRFGTDYVRHPGRVKTPLIRANRAEGRSSPPVWREATWDEALDLVADELSRIAKSHGGDAIAAYASAKATNEDNYVYQKMVRALLGTNNVDHCARLCHAGSVTGLQLSIGSSAMSNSIAEMEHLEAFIVTGSNTTETHPVISNFLKRAMRKNGAKLIVIDPRRIEMTDFATLWLRQNPGADVAVFQAMAHVIVEEKLYNPDFIASRTEGFEDYIESLKEFTPEWAEQVSGVPAESIREAARIYASANWAAIYWGMGISQSTHGTDNTLSLVNLAPDFWGITYERIEREGGVHWPCPSFDHPGTPYLFAEEFPRGRGKFWEIQFGAQSEQPDAEYPFNLSTGRVLYHWSGSTMTGRSALEQVYPEAVGEIHPEDAASLGARTGAWVQVSSRRGAITLRALVTGRSPRGTVFVPFHFAEAAANLLTLDKIDARAKIPDYKNTAVHVEKTSPPEGWDAGYAEPLLTRGAIKDPVQVH